MNVAFNTVDQNDRDPDAVMVGVDQNFHWLTTPPTSTSTASGLPLTWQSGVPLEPEFGAGRAAQLLVKRLFDAVIALLALMVLSVPFILVALAIKLSSRGPVLFMQEREGLDGKLFHAYKFRSMEQGDPTGVAQTVKDDPRITVVGRFLRKTSIDELPQLLNVLKGQMSLVGPRPHVPGMLAAGKTYRTLVPYYSMRLSVLPGITGWAQANGLRGSTDNANSAIDRVDHDIAYVQNFSLWLDLRILVKTVVREFLTGSGY